MSLREWANLIFSEIKNFKTTDFDPDKRYEFVLARLHFSKLANIGAYNHRDLQKFARMATDLQGILESYSYGNSGGKLKEFPFIRNIELKNIIQRDYRELDSILMPDGAWKSAVILSGSILESILYDVLTQENYIDIVNSSAKAPKFRGETTPIASGQWKLVDLINVSVSIKLLPEQRAASIDQVLRDYRNFVHPQKELRAQHPCTEAEAYMAKGCLDGVYNHLEGALSGP
ncbi:hypothetical protein [Paraburkholderia sp. GAS38]|uniref:hypothetical protein n=1 Tax=Paraburkholderia sp. GAS38 TaxID=3035133 RepID=UPI003D197830